MAIVEIDGGICGFKTTILVKKIDNNNLQVSIDSDCPNLKKVADQVFFVKPMREAFKNLHLTEAYKKILPGIAHPSCLVPSGAIKGIEVEAGLALPKDCHISIKY